MLISAFDSWQIMRQLTLLLVIAAMSAVSFGTIYDVLPQFRAGKLLSFWCCSNRKYAAIRNELLQGEPKRTGAWSGEIAQNQ